MRSDISRIIKRVPFNILRIFLYRYLLGYRIGKNVKIGTSLIKCNEVDIGDDVVIGSNNSIVCHRLVIGKKSKIISGNRITGKPSFIMGEDSRIINNHKIDLWNDVEIGNATWLAGDSSQIWTHGSLTRKSGKDLSVKINNNIYVGSGCLIAPGVIISDDTLIGLGSVITRSILDENTLVMGNPAKVVKENIDWRENW